MSLSQPAQITLGKKKIFKKCNECHRKRKFLDENHKICRLCYNAKLLFKPSGNKVIDDFIKHTQINCANYGGKMEFVPYDQFKDIEFIAEGGFSKIYKATWVDGPINWRNFKNKFNVSRDNNYAVVLKKLNNSKNFTSKELNELKVFYQLFSKRHVYRVSEYFGITQDPITKEVMIIMPYYNSGDLVHYICEDFFNINWKTKLDDLYDISWGLKTIHEQEIIHRDLHSGNIFFSKDIRVVIGDLGISKSATESTDDNENYGIIPYMAPEIFQGQKYTKASDIYSFGMIMWEFMTGRRPFWDRDHDTELIIEICDGLRPPIVTNAPEGYIDLMKECWHSDPKKRPLADILSDRIDVMFKYEKNKIQTTIIKSSDIGPITINNPGAIYKSRPLSGMIRSAMSLRSSRSRSLNLKIDKRKVEDDSIEDCNDEQNIKRRKLFENENNEYVTKEFEFELDLNMNFNQDK
ncbi:kinase-like domain-containing protein [Glomus cerebriforme]|uniref:Kinase-like domain-containing protein n=1 Tax=Glomus cerebriforme TaxID=658196 RepID=A0A397TGN4_9GLOM|nr:kinase-like domain-containing protein [Glomus cerebriforme]